MSEDDINGSRSRLLGSSDHQSLLRESMFGPLNLAQEEEEQNSPLLQQHINNYFSNNLFLEDEWHSEDYLHSGVDELPPGDSSWRLKDKMRTVGVALVVCLNIGIDPPDIVKPNPCARKECWFDPTGQKQKGLEYIGNALQQQYEKWQSKAKFKQCLDPTSEELRKVCLNLRKTSRTDRLLLHYNGHGVPNPTKNGELWVFGKHYTHYTPVAICELRSWLGDPAIYVLDCSEAGVLIPHLIDNYSLKDSESMFFDNVESSSYKQNASTMSLGSVSSENSTIVLAACKINEHLPFHPAYPIDIFTSCLTTPTTIAIRWFILQNPHSMRDVNPDIAESIPGKENDRKTPRGELNWILTAITDAIAWNTLPAKLFQKMFRKDLLVASLFRNFILSKRIMKSFNCTPQSYPAIPDSTTHALWQSWDMALESFLNQQVSLQRGSSMIDYRNNMPFNMPSNLSFFNDQLRSFEMWLEFGNVNSIPPPQLPVVLQVLLSQSHRLKALQLLKKFLALGTEAIRLSLILGIFPYILKLLQNPSDDIKYILISIWASVIGFDSSCRQELVREKAHICFIQGMTNRSATSGQRCLAAFVLAEVCNNYKDGQLACLQLSLHRSCTNILLQPEVLECNTLKLWICLCLFKLCEDFLYAKYLCMTEAGHTHLYPLLIDPDPTVRAAAVLALGELFGASTLANTTNNSMLRASFSSSASDDSFRLHNSTTPTAIPGSNGGTSLVAEKDLKEAELQLALQILECCTDGSVMVRLEAVYALSKFFIQPSHIDCIKVVAKAIYTLNMEKKYNSSSKGHDRRSTSPNLDGNKMNVLFPWHLTPSESQEIRRQVEIFIKSRSQSDEFPQSYFQQGMSYSNSASLIQDPPVPDFQLPPSHHNPLVTPLKPSSRQDTDSTAYSPPAPETAALMASAYVRLWLALTEVQGKDPHSLISQAAATIRFRVNALIAIDEKNGIDKPEGNSGKYISQSGSMTEDHFPANTWSSSIGNQSPYLLNSEFSFSSNNLNLVEQRMKQTQDGPMAPPLSPMGVGSPGANRTSRNVKFGSKVPKSSPFMIPTDNQSLAASFEPGSGIAQSYPGTSTTNISPQLNQIPSANSSAQSVLPKSDKTYFIEMFKDIRLPSEEDLLAYFSSNHYDTCKKLFIQPVTSITILPNGQIDPLSMEMKYNLYRNEKLKDVIYNVRNLYQMFEFDYHNQQPDTFTNPTMTPFSSSSPASSFIDFKSFPPTIGPSSNAPNSILSTSLATSNGSKSPAPLNTAINIKFEQKNTIHMENPNATSLVMFHAFQDVLVVASGSSASVYSLQNNAKLLEIKNRHSIKEGSSSPNGKNKLTNIQTQENALFAPLSNPRITSMTWINESYDPLLLLGSDDGVIKVWRDASCSDGLGMNQNASNSNIQASNIKEGISSSPGIYQANSNVELASAFTALPDIAQTSRGSGIVVSWQQNAGSLVVGGNCNTIRVWDLGREQSIRVFPTGVETCLTAMATSTVNNNFSSSFNRTQALANNSPLEIESTPVTWTFAGFADGSIAVYDERVNSNGGRVHYSHTHATWVNYAHLRTDIPEVVIGSVRGIVKYWDLRTMKTYKTLEVQKSPITSLAVHNFAPILATGSHAQFIKILTLGGEQLGNIIKYYDGFLGQRIGPISCLAFHPHRLLLAASSTDGIVSLYSSGEK